MEETIPEPIRQSKNILIISVFYDLFTRYDQLDIAVQPTQRPDDGIVILAARRAWPFCQNLSHDFFVKGAGDGMINHFTANYLVIR